MTLNGIMAVILRYFAEVVYTAHPPSENPGYVHVSRPNCTKFKKTYETIIGAFKFALDFR